MRLQVEQKELIKAVSTAASVVARTNVAIMDCLLFEASGGTLTVTGTSRQTTISATCEASVSEGGSACVNGADFRAFVSRASGVVSMALSESSLAISATPSSAKMPTLDAAKFAKIDGADASKEIEGGIAALELCGDFCSDSEARPNLHGVCFDGHYTSATDGTRLMLTKAVIGQGQVVPYACIPTIRKFGQRLFLGDKVWRTEAEGVRASGLLLNSDFPDVSRIVVRADPFMSCDADDLLAAVDAVTFGRASHTFIDFDGKIAKITGERFQGQHVEASSEISGDGSPAKLLVLTKQILEVAAKFEGRQVRFSTDGRVLMLDPVNTDAFALLSTVKDHRTSYPEVEAAA